MRESWLIRLGSALSDPMAVDSEVLLLTQSDGGVNVRGEVPMDDCSKSLSGPKSLEEVVSLAVPV